MKAEERVGQKFGKLTVLEIVNRDKSSSANFRCKCDCGKEITVSICNIGRNTNSCGCLIRESKISKQPWEVEYRKEILLASYRNNINFHLSLDEFKQLVQENCYYCDKPPYRNTVVGFLKRNGIDRVDNNRDYEISNCVTCCFTCNDMKGTLSQEAFYKQILLIYSNQK